jgi:hypothetical protein
MSTYDDASLVLVPSGYKNGVVFSQKPMDANGQLTFTRASSATRVQSDGLIEKVRTNLVLQSNTFSNASWSSGGTGVVLTSGQEDPNGGTSGWRFLVASASGYLSQNSVLLASTSMTVSVWVKSNTGVAQSFRMTANSGTQTSPFLIAGTSWTRVSWSFVSSSNGNILFPFSASALDLLVYGFQVETGDIATDYIPTTTAAVSVGPVSGLPRLDYLNSSCPRLLLEPQRTNICVFSEDYTNAVWSKFGTTVTANNGTSPDGYNSADLVVEDTSTGVHGIERATSPAAGTYTFSAFLKKGTRRYSGVRAVTNGYSNRYFALVDLDTGLVVSTNTVGTGVTWSHTVEAYANGWYRLSITGSHTSGNISLFLALSNSATPTYFGGAPSYTGSNSENALFWGCQIEVGSYASSYLNTLSTSVTRVADSASKTGISSLIGQTEGVLFVDFVPQNNPVASTQQWLMFLGSGSVYIAIHTTSAGKIRGNVANTTDQCIIDTTFNFVAGTRYKCALAYKANDFAFYVNGVLIGTDTSGTIPAVSTLQNNYNATAANSTNAGLNQLLLFTTRLTNDQLAELTSL